MASLQRRVSFCDEADSQIWHRDGDVITNVLEANVNGETNRAQRQDEFVTYLNMPSQSWLGGDGSHWVDISEIAAWQYHSIAREKIFPECPAIRWNAAQCNSSSNW